MSPVVASLSYHKIGNPPSDGWSTWNYTPTAEFRDQIGWFHNRGWKFLSASDFSSALLGDGELPAKTVLITFDDAYESLLQNAVPVLKQFSAPAIVFTPTDFVGASNLFDHGIEPQELIADWKMLAMLEADGISVESHGCSHRAFSDLTPMEIQRELEMSKQAIRENLGKDSKFFAFPYGDSGNDRQTVEKLLRAAGYDLAFLYGGGFLRISSHSEPFFLPRLAMGPGVDLDALVNGAQ